MHTADLWALLPQDGASSPVLAKSLEKSCFPVLVSWYINMFLGVCVCQMVPGGGGTVPTIQRIPLPGAEMLEEEPLYVNAKQYHRILKRRQARAKLEAEGKIPKERRVSDRCQAHSHDVVYGVQKVLLM